MTSTTTSAYRYRATDGHFDVKAAQAGDLAARAGYDGAMFAPRPNAASQATPARPAHAAGTPARILPLGAVLAALLAPAAALAATESPWVENDHAAVRLVAASDGFADTDEARLGLEFRLKPGWKIYWRSPGDAGLPPEVDWSRSDNLAKATLRWPLPERFTAFGLETLGYSDHVILPVRARATAPDKPLRLAADVRYLACDDICIPYDASLTLSLAPGAAPPSAHAHQLNRYEARVPVAPEALGVAITRATFTAEGSGNDDGRLTVLANSEMPFAAPDIIVEGPPEVWFGSADITLSDGGRTLRAVLPADGIERLADGLDGHRVTVTLGDGAHAFEQSLAVEAAGSGSGLGFVWILSLALLGGLILNVMPCVLPVLALKLMGAVRHGGAAPLAVRLHFMASAAGILSTFLLLALALVQLKAAGVAIGWGIQFQQPLFLSAMVVVVSLFAANLWGAFSVPLPRWLAAGGERAAGVGGLGGSFLAGAFAAVLATPCSAPFVGTAAAFALSRGPAEIVAVFAALGLGLALPYLAVTAFPAMATRLPRPGPWMVRLQHILGFALAATAVWLLSVLAAQTAPSTAILIGGLVLLAGAVLAFRRRLASRVWQRSAVGVVVAAFATALLAPVALETAPPSSREILSAEALPWVAFDEAAIPDLVAGGQVVFVDVTAEWCITCQVNKVAVLYRDPVRTLLSGPGVVVMRADWTRPDERISRYLGSFGRYGIPFNAVYGPGRPRGLALPELLTPDAVQKAIRQAQAADFRAPQTAQNAVD